MNSTEYRFHVPGISCGHCVASIVKALQALGVSVAADTAGKELRIEAPPAVSREQLVQQLTEAGYPPSA